MSPERPGRFEAKIFDFAAEKAARDAAAKAASEAVFAKELEQNEQFNFEGLPESPAPMTEEEIALMFSISESEKSED